MRCINRISSNINSMRSGPDPEHSNAGGGGGGGASGPDPEQSNTGYDVCGVSRKGESMRGGLPLSYRGPGEIPREKFGKLWCRRSVF